MAIRWEPDFSSALARARAEDKLLFIDFFSPL
jgi:hypothetical protein